MKKYFIYILIFIISISLVVGITGYDTLVSAKNVYDVVQLIDNVTGSPITLESENDIALARRAYDTLSEEEMEKVKNYDILESAEKVYAVVKYIDKIGELTGDAKTGASIDFAEQRYNMLNDFEKEMVGNYDYLLEAKEKYPALKQAEREKEQKMKEDLKNKKTTSGYSNKSNRSSSSGKKCVMCNGTGYVKYYYGSSDLEAYLSGHDPYTVGKCTSCGGTGRD